VLFPDAAAVDAARRRRFTHRRTSMLQNLLDRSSTMVGDALPGIVGAIVILIVGWIVALVIAAVVRGILRRTTIDNRLAAWIGGARTATLPIERYIGTTVFWLVMLFVLVAFFDALNLPVVTGPLNALLGQLGEFAPRLFGALLLLVGAAVLAMLLRRLVKSGLTAVRADERLGTGDGLPVASSLGEVVYWIVWLLFLPMILSTLQLTGLLAPVQTLLDKALAFLPNLLAAAVALVVGWFIAHLVRRIVTNLLAAAGADRLGAESGVSKAIGQASLSAAVGTVVYVLILIPVVIAALNALQIDAVTAPASNMLNSLLAAIPAIFAAAIVLALSYMVGRVVAELVSRALAATGFDRAFAAMGLAGGSAVAPGRAPSAIAGQLVLIAIMFFAAIEAAGLLGFTALQVLLSGLLVQAGHVLLGLVVFGVGLYLAGLAARVINASGAAGAGLLSRAARVAIVVLAGAMALRQMGLANEIVNLAFGLVVGAIAVAVAIAFGLGAREAAGRQVEEWIQAYRGRR
jgi:hypothetical protein